MSKRRTTQQWRRVLISLWALAALVSACGSDTPDEVRAAAVGAEAEAEADDAPVPTEVPSAEVTEVPATQIDPTVAPEPTAVATPTPLPTPVLEPDPNVPALESVYDAPVANGGWPVQAGTWSSASFSTPLRFDLPVDATLMTDGLGRLEFAIGPVDQPEGWLYIIEPVALNRPTGPIPIDLIDPTKAYDGSTILSEALGTGPLGEFTLTDFRPDSQPAFEQFTRPCFRRPTRRCIAPWVTASGQNAVVLTMDDVHRVAGFAFGEEGRLNVMAVANDATNVDFLDHVDTVASSLMTMASAWSGTVALDTLGMGGEALPAGQWVRGVGSTLMSIDLEQDLAIDALLFPELDVVGLQADGASMFLGHHDPRYDLATGDLPAGAGPWAPVNLAEVVSGLESVAESFDIAQTTFAGLPATEFSNVVFTGGEPCPSLVIAIPPGTLCSVWYRTTSSPIFGYSDPDSVKRLLYLEDLGFLISVTVPVGNEKAAEQFAAFEAALTLSPMG